MILTALCGHGHFDLAAYDAYRGGRIVDFEPADDAFGEAPVDLPVPAS